jgi:CelD/BcsL family acetyltransferase involved in cellulose biosynthesis
VTSFETEWIDDTARFAELAPEWDAILPPDSRPFDLHCWYLAWLEAFADGQQLAVCTVREGGALAGALPLLRGKRGLEASANVHSGAFRPVATGPEAMDALIGAAMQETARLTLGELQEGDRCVDALVDGARRAGMVPFLEEGTTSPIVDTSGDLEAWIKEGNSKWKKGLRASRRKMDKKHEAVFEVARSPQDLEAEISEGFAVEASGWKGEAGTAIVSRPETEAFYRGIAAAFHDRGELRLSRIALDGEPVAFNYCLEHRGRLYGLKAGFDERFRKLSPGLVLQLAIVERCFETEVNAFELFGGDADWKARLATSQRSHATLRAYRRNAAGLARYAYRAALRPRLRSAYRRLRPGT